MNIVQYPTTNEGGGLGARAERADEGDHRAMSTATLDLPYDYDATVALLDEAGFRFPQAIARNCQPLAASYVIEATVADAGPLEPLAMAVDAVLLGVLQRLLRVVQAEGEPESGADPTVADAVAHMLAERAISPDEVGTYAAALATFQLIPLAAQVLDGARLAKTRHDAAERASA